MGHVNLVLLMDISRARKTLTIEKYVPYARQHPRTRAQAAGTVHVRRCVSTIVVNMKANPPSVQGAPLTLEFEIIVGRPAVGQEHDVVFDSAALLAIAGGVFRGMP
ncbi:uncharacterized protein AKAW2_60188A [Aspergillus luchuensis]|uniref:Uncharacterized protein n=1 Tax=Aspergillus kawachii TaxID=1069201 RepID=A0A7R7WFB9_ASPKA|nr:uncharacterized protein AKAW2_60188A [Aspergillus luchuensis]BCS01924.1 hypothetical protein AKAW2_60188A [Aspergillus luchuensis]